jgi:hypothetical protein
MVISTCRSTHKHIRYQLKNFYFPELTSPPIFEFFYLKKYHTKPNCYLLENSLTSLINDTKKGI